MSKTIGIDLGTTNSCMAILVDGKATIIPNAEGDRTTPSVVAFTHDVQRLVGASAKNQQVNNPRNTISSIKRFMGRLWNEVTEEMAMAPYLFERSADDGLRIVVEGRQYAPQEISAMILQKLKADAEIYLGEEVTDAVITVPAYFNNAQREATRDAGKIAGLNVLRIINEPTAASLAYGLDQAQEQTVMVFDLGGGTFDVSILDIGEGLFEVKSTNGDNHLGGDDFDQSIVNWMLSWFRSEHGVDLAANQMELPLLYKAAEQAKIALSQVITTEINLPFIITPQASFNRNGVSSPPANESACASRFTDETTSHSTRLPNNSNQVAGYLPEGEGSIALSPYGGKMDRGPGENESLRDFYGKPLTMQLTRTKLNELASELLDRTVWPIKQALADAGLPPSGIDHLVLVGGMTRMPSVLDKLKQIISKEPHQGIDPDEVVAIGAAIQAGILRGDVKGILLLDVTPLSLGIETKGGVFTRLIARNSSIPTSRTKTFTTAEDNQTSMEIHILQGESEMAVFNKTLGVFHLDGITPTRRGMMEIDVSFDIDANGIIHVHAVDIATGNEQEIRVKGGTGLSSDEVSRMVQEAEAHAEANSRLRELADARNLAEVLADEIGRSLTARREKIENCQVSAIENHISGLRLAMVGSDISELRDKTRALTEAAQVLLAKSASRRSLRSDSSTPACVMKV